jgi:hypothetical protein
MRPKTTSLKKKETVKRKNHEHWLKHKHDILAKRNIQTLKLEQLQILDRNECEVNDVKVNDAFNYLSINKTTNDLNTELFDDDLNTDLMDRYVTGVDEDGVAFDDAPDDCHQNEFEEEEEEEEDIEETLNEQQMEFAEECINMDTSAMSVREYDELVSKKFQT